MFDREFTYRTIIFKNKIKTIKTNQIVYFFNKKGKFIKIY